MTGPGVTGPGDITHLLLAARDGAETARAMDISERTVKRDWRKARAFLYRALEGGD